MKDKKLSIEFGESVDAGIISLIPKIYGWSIFDTKVNDEGEVIRLTLEKDGKFKTLKPIKE